MPIVASHDARPARKPHLPPRPVSARGAPAASGAPSERHEQYLSTAKLTKNLRRSSVRGGAAMVTAQTATFVINTGGTAVLARILEPRDFGLIAMVATFTRLIEQLKDMGHAMATVQRPQISHAQVSYLFWANGAVGLGAAQIQGVWVNPRHRGKGLAAPGMAAVVEHTRARFAPIVSLYVNSYNTAALATYSRVGFRQVGTFATILL